MPPLRLEMQRQFNRLDVLVGMLPGSASRELLATNALDAYRLKLPSVAPEGGEDFLRRRPEIIAAERRIAAAQTAYLGGAVDLIDTLDADRQLLTARDSLTRTQVDVARAAVGAFRALGGGW